MVNTATSIDMQAQARRRTWFAMCRTLGIQEIDQKAIADRFIPDSEPDKFNDDGEISRKPLFRNTRYWSAAFNHLKSIENTRKRNHKRLDGSSGDKATLRQLNCARTLARKLGWNENGEDDLTFRLGRFAAHQIGDTSPNAIAVLKWLTPKQLSDVIIGLQRIKSPK